MTLYNIRSTPTGGFTLAKFDDDLAFETSYVVSADLKSCTCPAGPRPSCKHRKMVPRMVHQLGTGWFYNYDTQKWHRPVEEPEFVYTEDNCPSHVASAHDPKVCGNCGVHIDSFRPDESELASEASSLETASITKLCECQSMDECHDAPDCAIEASGIAGAAGSQDHIEPSVAEPAKPVPVAQGIRRRV